MKKSSFSHTPKLGADTVDGVSAMAGNPENAVTQERVASLAYQLWMERGCPLGSPEDDWFRAKQQLGDAHQ